MTVWSKPQGELWWKAKPIAKQIGVGRPSSWQGSGLQQTSKENQSGELEAASTIDPTRVGFQHL